MQIIYNKDTTREYLSRGGSRAAATCKMERFVIIVNGWKLEAVSYYHKALHLGCCSSPRSASVIVTLMTQKACTAFYMVTERIYVSHYIRKKL